jgi:hypothetical protein
MFNPLAFAADTNSLSDYGCSCTCSCDAGAGAGSGSGSGYPQQTQ